MGPLIQAGNKTKSHKTKKHEHSRVWETDRWARVRQITALPPGKVQAPDELQEERMGGVKHGKANDVGLLVHDILQSQQGEILNRKFAWEMGGEENWDVWLLT